MDILLGMALSQHLHFQNDYNQIHPHIRLEHNEFIAGIYYNSEEEISPYIGYRLEYDNSGLELGAVGGYSKLGGVIPYVRYTYDMSDSVILFASPTGEKNNGEMNYGVVLGIELQMFSF